jgi:hypothetical protein
MDGACVWGRRFENGKYLSLTGDREPAIFLLFLASPQARPICWCARLAMGNNLRHALYHRDLRHGCLLGQQAVAGGEHSRCPRAQRKEVCRLHREGHFVSLVMAPLAGLILDILFASRLLTSIVYQASRVLSPPFRAGPVDIQD